MTGVVGIDSQHSWSAVVVNEVSTEGTQCSPVGDGRRHLVPHAYDDEGRWGTAAAEAALDGSPETSLLSWRRDPWTVAFLAGVRDRLYAYLGDVAPTGAHGYAICTTEPAGPEAPDAATLGRTFAEAGLPDCWLVDPAAALVCRWLADETSGRLERPRTVLAVVCGEERTTASAFRVEPTDDGRVTVRRDGTPPDPTPHGVGPWHAELADTVVERCREGVRRGDALAVLDGVLEFGARLRSQRDPLEPVEWMGPLADRMFATLQVSRRSLAGQHQVVELTDAIRDRAAEAMRTVDDPVDLVLAGGLGAVWPFAADTLQEHAPVWQSRRPELDLAVGATWWPALAARFGTDAHPIEVAPAPAVEQLAEPVREPDAPATEERPPWLRD
ncbi:MAG: hypothetical protein GEV10_25200 [Streptosporangiales bacterium]|nr:hypothetical protein [Streptosporangiales bacterium]